MALTLRSAITANQTTFEVLGSDDLQPGDFKTIDSETIIIRTANPATVQYLEPPRYQVNADRGREGSREAAHAAAATLTAYSAGGGGPVAASAVTFDNTEAGLPGDPVDVQGAIEAGAGGLPVATPAVASIDRTTYDNPLGTGKIATLVLSGDEGAAFAVALEGDAFPRWLMVGDATDGIYLGDGTADPYTGGVAICFGGTLAGTHYLLLEGPSSNVQIGVQDANAGPIAAFGGGIRPNGNVVFMSDYGEPTKGGNVGDIYFRGDPANNNELIYRCTVAGTAGLATWVAVPLG